MDTLATIITLLKPQAVGTKIIRGAGRWGVRYSAFEQPSFALMLQGSCLLAVDGMPATTLETGDFILFPEIFTSQLLSLIQSDSPGAAVRRLSDFTDQYLELFTRLAVKYNVNVVGGSYDLWRPKPANTNSPTWTAMIAA